MALPFIFDGHNDALFRLIRRRRPVEEFTAGTRHGHLDLPRAKAGGLSAAMFASFAHGKPPAGGASAPPAARHAPLPAAEALRQALGQAALLFRIEAASDGRLRVARSVHDLTACRRAGALAAVWHLEGAEAIDPGLDALEVLTRAGLRSLGLTWSRPNAFGHGVTFEFPGSPDTGPGLTPAGRRLVGACNRLGVVIDVSHLNLKGFRDVARFSAAPLVASHSCVHAICPSSRNLTDWQLDAIGGSGGIVGVNFFPRFVRPDGQANAGTPLEMVVAHARYIADRIGVTHVGLGSDFDGALMPRAQGDAAALPRLLAALGQAGFSKREVALIAGENWLRVLRATWH